MTVECHRGLEQGRVFITPDQLVGTAPVSGTITGVLPSERPESACDSLPGAGMPPLGATIDTPRGTGLVIRIDPVRGSAVVRTEDGVEVEVRDAGQE
ncbi:MAG TPA: hypothetical protein VKX16_11645 [Chloroflexota bacterium]|nr:hypothetical protein [Chloroflexota bacterium]